MLGVGIRDSSWLLEIGCRLLATGCSPLALSCSLR